MVREENTPISSTIYFDVVQLFYRVLRIGITYNEFLKLQNCEIGHNTEDYYTHNSKRKV